MPRPLKWCSCLALTLAAATGPLQAQARPLRARAVRALNFGIILPGVRQAISPADPLKSGQIDIAGARDASVQLVFALPAALTGPGGSSLPVSFGAQDAGYSASRSAANQIFFDPRTPITVTLPKNGRASVFLGGTLQPSPSQPAGAYTASVTLTVAPTGV